VFWGGGARRGSVSQSAAHPSLAFPPPHGIRTAPSSLLVDDSQPSKEGGAPRFFSRSSRRQEPLHVCKGLTRLMLWMVVAVALLGAGMEGSDVEEGGICAGAGVHVCGAMRVTGLGEATDGRWCIGSAESIPSNTCYCARPFGRAASS